MMEQEVRVFVTHAFKPRQNAYTRGELIATIEDACVTAKADLAKVHPRIKFRVQTNLDEYGIALGAQVLRGLDVADICIVDISDNNPNVFYELGALHAWGREPILLKSNREESEFPIPSDVSGLYLLKYDLIQDIVGRLLIF